MKYVQSKAWAPNTYKAIKSEWRTFKIYCGEAGITSLPIDHCEICYYAIWLSSTGRIKTKASMAQYVSAVRTVHKMLRLAEVPTPSQYGPLDMILKGTRRIAQHRIKKSLPVTPPILKNLLCSTISTLSGPTNHTDNTLLEVYKSLSLIYYLSMLRSSNLVKTTTKVDLDMVLCWDRVKPLHNNIRKGIVLTITKSKNNQFGERVHEVPLAASPHPMLCPVKAILKLVKIYGKDRCAGRNPVFQAPRDDGTFTPVNRDKFAMWFKHRINHMGLDASAYTLHGYRHGGIQETLLAEGNIALCKLSSDHSSDAIQEYAFVPPERRLNISAKVNASLADAIALEPTRRLELLRI